MTRRRRNATGRRTQMPADPLEQQRIARLDAQTKARHHIPDLHERLMSMPSRNLELTPYERDVIEEARKKPKTWDEINSNRAGGVDR